MKRTERFQTRSRQQSLYHIGVMIYLIFMQWISIDSALVDTAAVRVAIEDKVTLPSRNEATNPLKEPTPSTLQGTFLGSKLTDSNNGSTSTPPADAPLQHFDVGGDVGGIDGGSTTTAAAADETVWNVRTAAAATLPVDGRDRNASLATAAKSDPATTTDRPLDSWENIVHISSTVEQQSSLPRLSSSSPLSSSSLPTDYDSATTASGVDYGPGASNKNPMDNMLKSWFDHRPNSAAVSRKYYAMANEYLQQKNGVEAGSGGLNGAVGGAGGVIRGAGDTMGEQFKMNPSSKAAMAAAVGNNKNLFERWDEASEEQERVLEDAMRSDRPAVDVAGDRSSSSVLAADQNTPSRWFVLLLSGNSTVAQMRRTDFAKYLKLNLAARLSLEYDEVKINRVLVVPPRLMVNVSVVPISERASAAAAAVAAAAAAASSSSLWSSSASDLAAAAVSDRVIENDDPLHNLVETNATLMELSGEEYRVERFMSLKSQKPQSMEEAAVMVSNRHADIDYFIYATVGPLCFIVVLGFLLLTFYKYVRKHPVQWPWKRKFKHPSFWPGGRGGDHHHMHRHRRMMDECSGDCGSGGGRCDATSGDEMGGGGLINVIYSGEFEQSQQQQLSGSWLDDASFVPDDSLDRIRTPTLLRTPPAAKNKTFTEMLQQCSDGGVVDVGACGAEDHAGRLLHHNRSSRNGQCAAAAAVAVHAQSPRLSRDNKLRILGCKQSCLLLPAVQPVNADGKSELTRNLLSCQSTEVVRENDCGQP